jgi:hypothetical protein
MQQGLQIAKVKRLQYGEGAPSLHYWEKIMSDKNIQEQFLKLVVELYFKGLTVKESIERAKKEINGG